MARAPAPARTGRPVCMGTAAPWEGGAVAEEAAELALEARELAALPAAELRVVRNEKM
jgi:hypothetical protein